MFDTVSIKRQELSILLTVFGVIPVKQKHKALLLKIKA